MKWVDIQDGKVTSVFGSPQDAVVWPSVVSIEETDPLYVAYFDQIDLNLNLSDLSARTKEATAVIAAAQSRIDAINDAVDLNEATEDEMAEIPALTADLAAWKRYRIDLGRVKGLDGWPQDPQWPKRPGS